MSSFGPNSRYSIPSGGSSTSLVSESGHIRYPDPFYDIAQSKLPSGGIKTLFDACTYAVHVNPVVKSVTQKMAAYPITTLAFTSHSSDEALDSDLEKSWQTLLQDNLNIELKQISLGLDYYGYGNSILSLRLPFVKYLVCKGCRDKFDLTNLRQKKDYTFSSWEFEMTCPKCEHRGAAGQEDVYIRSMRKTRLKRWPLKQMDIEYYPMSGDCEYFYTPSDGFKKQLQRGDVKALSECPVEMFAAIKANKSFRLDPRNVFHFRPPSVVVDDHMMGWGFPPILPALKDQFFLQLLMKANEALAVEHIVPWRWVSPASTNTLDPYRALNLNQWRKSVEVEIKKKRGDPNHVTVFPVPLQFQQLGGQGKMMLSMAEVVEWRKMIVAGLGAPEEMWSGGLRWSASSVSLRMLENVFMTYRLQHHRMLNLWLIPLLSRVFKLPIVKAEMTSFKMGDDVQSKQVLISLRQQGLISDKAVLAEFGKDPRKEQAQIDQENRLRAHVMLRQKLEETRIQGEMQVMSTHYQLKAQALSQPQATLQRGAPEAQSGPDPTNDTMDQAQEGMVQSQQNMQPLPEQGAPRRGGGTSMA